MQLKKSTVLLIDDEALILRSLKLSLEILNYNVLTATNGKEALVLIKENPLIDAIVLDKSMPEMNGFDTLKKLKKISASPQVIMASGFYEEGDMKKFKSAGAFSCLRKPFSISQLMEEIQQSIH